MKRIDTTQETATSWSPFKVESKAFMQDANKEMVQALCQNLISNSGLTYSPTVPYYIGQYNNLIFPSDGTIFFNGELYIMRQNSGSIFAVIDTTPDAVADPTTFSDNTTHNIHKDRYLSFTNTVTGSLFPVANIIDLTTIVTTPTLLNSWGVNAGKTPKHTKVGKKVLFEGAVLKVGGNSGVMFNLPVYARPSIERVVICSSYSLSVSSFNSLIIATNGDVSLYDQTGGVGGSGFVINLDGISYTL